MANLFQTNASGLAMLKNYYQGPLRDQFSEDVAVYRAVEKQKQGWSGQQIIKSIRSVRNQGIGAAADNGALPNIGRQTTKQAIIASKYNYLRFGVTGPMIKSSQSDVGSFVRAADYELQMGYKDLSSDCNRQYSWDGTGTLAAVNTASVASTTLVIKGRESTEEALKFVDVGMVLDIYNSTGVTLKAGGVTVNSISTGTPISATATLILDIPVTTAAGDILVRANTINQEIQGMLLPLDGNTTTIFNIDRSSAISFQGNNQSGASAALNLDLLQQAYNQGLRRGGARYSAIFSDFASLRYYQKLLTPDKRYVNSVEGDGSFGKKDKFYLEFMGIPWVPDKDSPTRIFFLDSSTWTNFVLSDMEFADETGSMYIAQSSVDALEVRVRYFSNLFCEQPSANAVVSSYISP